MLELPAIILGILLGALAGLTPALHNNTITSFILSLNLPFSPEILSLFIVALASAHLVFESVPAIFLFIPDENTVLSILPGQRLLREGKGFLALRVMAASSMLSLALSLVLLPLSLAFFPQLFLLLQPFTPFILLFASLFLLLSERSPRSIALASFIFLSSGVLGLIALRSPLLSDPLLPSFTGLFALPAILLALKSNEEVPQQKEPRSQPIPFQEILPCIILGTLLGGIADLFPGLSSAAQIAVFASVFLELTPLRFLSLVSSIATAHTFFSFSSLFAIEKARIGAAVAVRELLGKIEEPQLMLLLGAATLSISLSLLLLLALSGRIVRLLSSLDHRSLNLLLLLLIPFLVLLLQGLPGILVLGIACCIGIIPPLTGIRRTHVMGLILLPAILYEFGV